MERDYDLIGSILLIAIMIVIYVVNFVQMIVAIFEGHWTVALVKAIGVFTALGSFITVWF